MPDQQKLPFPWSLGQFSSQEQINALGQELSRRAQESGGFANEDELVTHFVHSLDTVGVPRADVPDTVLGSFGGGVAKSLTSVPRLAGALIEAGGGAVGLDSVRDYGKTVQDYYKGVDARNFDISPEAQAFARADDTFWTVPQVAQGVGQGAGDLGLMLATGGLSGAATAGKVGAEIVGREAAKGAVERLAARAATKTGTRTAMAVGGFKGGAATVEQLNQSAQTQGDYATNLLAGIPSAIVNGVADTAIMRYLPQWSNVPPRVRGTLLQEFGAFLQTAGSGALAEGGTEGLQSLMDSAIQSMALRLSNRQEEMPTIMSALKQGLFEAGIGAITGGVLAGGGNITNVQGPNDRAPRTTHNWTEKQYQEQLNTAYDKLSTPELTNTAGWSADDIENAHALRPYDPNQSQLAEIPEDFQVGSDYATELQRRRQAQELWSTRATQQDQQYQEQLNTAYDKLAPPQVTDTTNWTPEEVTNVRALQDYDPSRSQPAEIPEDFQARTGYGLEMRLRQAGLNQYGAMDYSKLSAKDNEKLHKVIGPYFTKAMKYMADLNELSQQFNQAAEDEQPAVQRRIDTTSKLVQRARKQGTKAFYREAQVIAERIDVPDGTWVDLGNGTSVFRDNGRTVLMRNADAAPVNPGVNTQADAGRIRATEEGLNGEEIIITRPNGTRVRVPVDSLISLIDPKSDTRAHEKMHSWMRLFLTDPQVSTLRRVYGSDEGTADAFGKWADKRAAGHPLFVKLQDIARDLYHLVTLQRQKYLADKVFRSVFRDEVPDAAVQSRSMGRQMQMTTEQESMNKVLGSIGQESHPLVALRQRFSRIMQEAPRRWLGRWEDLRIAEDKQAEQAAGKNTKTMTPMERVWYEITGGSRRLGYEWRKAHSEESIYYAALRMVHEVSARVAAIRGDAEGNLPITDMHGNKLTGVKNYTQITGKMDPKTDLEPLSAYMLALSARDRFKLGKGPAGFSLKEATDTINLIERTRPDLVQAQKDLQTLGDAGLHWLVESGNIGQAEFEMLKKLHPNHAPFWALPELAGKVTIDGVREAPIPVHKAFGGATIIENPLLSMQKNLENYAAVAHRTMMENKALSFLEQTDHPELGGVPLVRKLSPKDRNFRTMLKQFNIDSESLIKALTKAGAIELAEIPDADTVPVTEANAPAVMARIMIAAGKMQSDPNTNTFIRPAWSGGKLRYEVYETANRQLFNVFTDFDKDTSAINHAVDALNPYMGPFARMMRAMTVASPTFAARNPFRDVPMHALLAPDTEGLSLGKNLMARIPHLRGLWVYMKDPAMRQQFNQSAVSQNTLVTSALDNSATTLGRKLRAAKDGQVWDTIMHPVEAFNEVVGSVLKYPEMLSNFSENVGRIGVYDRIYKQEIAKGRPADEAARYAFNRTVETPQNFSNLGIEVQALNKICAFFGPQIGGWYRMWEHLRTHPGAMAGFAATMATASIGLLIHNMRDERWKDVPEYEKDMYWFVLRKGMPVIRIPKPFEAGTFFGSVPERMAEMYLTDSPHEVDKVLQAISAFNIPTPMPTVLAPIFQNALNRDWKGSPIVSRGMENLAPSEQISPYTSETAKMLASTVRGLAPDFIEKSLEKARLTSPLGVDNLIRSYGSGMGKILTDTVADPLLRFAQGRELRKPGPSMTASDVPGVSGFVSRYPSTAAQPLADFYDTFDKVQESHSTLLNMRKQMVDSKRLQQFAKDNQVNLMAYSRLQDVSETLNKLNRSYKQIQIDPRLSRDDKRKQMENLASRMARIAEQANNFYIRVESRN